MLSPDRRTSLKAIEQNVASFHAFVVWNEVVFCIPCKCVFIRSDLCCWASLWFVRIHCMYLVDLNSKHLQVYARMLGIICLITQQFVSTLLCSPTSVAQMWDMLRLSHQAWHFSIYYCHHDSFKSTGQDPAHNMKKVKNGNADDFKSSFSFDCKHTATFCKLRYCNRTFCLLIQ